MEAAAQRPATRGSVEVREAAGSPQTLSGELEAAARRRPDTPGYVFRNDEGVESSATYAELADQVAQLSAGLAEVGVRRGDRVALWMTNRSEWIVSCYAACRIGASVVPVNTWLTPREVKY